MSSLSFTLFLCHDWLIEFNVVSVRQYTTPPVISPYWLAVVVRNPDCLTITSKQWVHYSIQVLTIHMTLHYSYCPSLSLALSTSMDFHADTIPPSEWDAFTFRSPTKKSIVVTYVLISLFQHSAIKPTSQMLSSSDCPGQRYSLLTSKIFSVTHWSIWFSYICQSIHLEVNNWSRKSGLICKSNSNLF